MNRPGPSLSVEGLDLEARSIFGTPVAVQVLPQAAALNAELAPALLAQAGKAAGQPGEGWRSAAGAADWGGAALAAVIEAAQRLAEALESISSEHQEPWSVRVALERLETNEGIAIGSLAEARWCARYVVADGGAAQRPDYGGRFEAQDPRGVGPVMYAPHLTIADAAGPTLGISQTVGLPAGALLVYPGWLLHGIEPYRGPDRLLALVIQLDR